MKKWCIKYFRSQRRAIWCSAPTRNLQNIKDRYSEQLTIESQWLGTTNLKKNYVYARCFVECYRAHYVIEVLILLSWQWRFYAYAYTIYIITQFMYNEALYTYINVSTYMHPLWNVLHLLSSRSGNGPDFLKCVNVSCEKMLAYSLCILRLKKQEKCTNESQV